MVAGQVWVVKWLSAMTSMGRDCRINWAASCQSWQTQVPRLWAEESGELGWNYAAGVRVVEHVLGMFRKKMSSSRYLMVCSFYLYHGARGQLAPQANTSRLFFTVYLLTLPLKKTNLVITSGAETWSPTWPAPPRHPCTDLSGSLPTRLGLGT